MSPPTTEAELVAAIRVEEAHAAGGPGRFTAIERLRVLEEDAARAALGVPLTAEAHALVPLVVERVMRGLEADVGQRAVEHLAAAERWQWRIGSWATGGGEGLASMSEVRTLQLARAWVLSTRAVEDATTKAKALALLREVAEDPNRVAERLMPQVRSLRERLGVGS